VPSFRRPDVSGQLQVGFLAAVDGGRKRVETLQREIWDVTGDIICEVRWKYLESMMNIDELHL
jgi:hypothetical protein